MANTKYKDRDIRKLTRVGKASFCVTLPVEYVGKLGWKEKQKVIAQKRGKGILITDWPERTEI